MKRLCHSLFLVLFKKSNLKVCVALLYFNLIVNCRVFSTVERRARIYSGDNENYVRVPEEDVLYNAVISVLGLKHPYEVVSIDRYIHYGVINLESYYNPPDQCNIVVCAILTKLTSFFKIWNGTFFCTFSWKVYTQKINNICEIQETVYMCTWTFLVSPRKLYACTTYDFFRVSILISGAIFVKNIFLANL